MTINIELMDRVAKITLHRPEARNALNSELATALLHEMGQLDRNSNIGCVVITGSEKYFAAGADIKEMSVKNYQDMNREDYFSLWDSFTNIRVPKIAAVSGYAHGGGCELAMMCDLIFAAESARFSQPEITLGVIPGIGGSQRLTRLVGKSKAMDMILTGRQLTAIEAESAGLISRVYPDNELIESSLDVARQISQFSYPAVIAAKEAIDRASEISLREGLMFERRTFHSLFANLDQAEGMQAFIEKRTPNFLHK